MQKYSLTLAHKNSNNLSRQSLISYLKSFSSPTMQIQQQLSIGYNNNSTNISELSHYRGLSVAGSIFMMISFSLIVVLHYKFSRYLMYFLLVFMPFAVFLILIGMGLSQTSTYYQDQYKFPVAYWFIELMLLLLGFLVIHEVKVSNPEQGNPNQAPKKQQQKYEVPGNANI